MFLFSCLRINLNIIGLETGLLAPYFYTPDDWKCHQLAYFRHLRFFFVSTLLLGPHAIE
jgi:hypothetical protein